MGIASVSRVSEYAPWQTNLLWLSIASALCGALLALIGDRAFWLIGAASLLAVVIFGGLWSYLSWALLGPVFSFLEIALSDFVFLHVAQRGAIMFADSVVFGLLGVVVAVLLFPGMVTRE